MPRISRNVAQRLGSQTKSRKRRVPRVGDAATPPAVERILDEVAPEEEAAPRRAVTSRPADRVVATGPVAATPAKGSVTRRRHADYAEEYHYVWGDLRRIAFVAGGLLLLLLVLSLFIR